MTTRRLRILASVIGAGATLVYLFFASPLFFLAIPFITAVGLPLLATYLLLVGLSYGLTGTLMATGSNAPPTSLWARIAVGAYLVVSTLVVVVGVVVVVSVIAAAPATLVGIGALLLVLFPHAVLVCLLYIVGATVAPRVRADRTERMSECFVRGLLIGINGAMNGVLAFTVYGIAFAPFVGIEATIVITAVLALGTLLTSLASAFVVPRLPLGAQVQAFVEALAGWHSWLMPMSWNVCRSGWGRFYLSWVGHVLSLFPAVFPLSRYRIDIADISRNTGMIALKGGWAAMSRSTAFNVGCFSFINRRFNDPARLARQLEEGHHLNLAAFGGVFGWIGALNERNRHVLVGAATRLGRHAHLASGRPPGQLPELHGPH